jgi:hypothetical protein
MNAQDYASLASQVARQTPELAALDTEIAQQQPGVDLLQAALDVAQVALEQADDEGKADAQAAVEAAKQALSEPADALSRLKDSAAAIRTAIAQCQSEMDASGLTVDVEAVELAAAKAAVWERIKSERDRRKLEGGYSVGGKWYHSDTFSRTQQIGLVMLGASLPSGLQWKAMDGSFVSMTQTLAQQIFGAAAQQDIATFTAAETHKAAMEQSADPLGYDFSAGWPAIYTP